MINWFTTDGKMVLRFGVGITIWHSFRGQLESVSISLDLGRIIASLTLWPISAKRCGFCETRRWVLIYRGSPWFCGKCLTKYVPEPEEVAA